MITGVSSGLSSEISEQLSGPACLPATKEAGLIFDSVLSGMIKGKEPAPILQEEPTVSAETKHPEESTDHGTTGLAYMNLFPYRTFQNSQASATGMNVPTEEKTNQTGTWFDSVSEKQQAITAKLDYSASAAETPTRPQEIEAGAQPESMPLSDPAAIGTSASGSPTGERGTTPDSIGEREIYPIGDTSPRQQPERTLSGSENSPEQTLENSLKLSAPVLADAPLKETAAMTGEQKMEQMGSAFPEQSTELQIRETTIRQEIADESENSELSEASAKAPDSHENKTHVNQGPFIRDLTTENVLGHKPSKVTAFHIEDIQKTIEMQIEKTPTIGNTVVKILLTPDNIGDIHLQLIKTKDSITAVLHVQDAETKGLLEEQLPLLMEPFKQSIPDSPLSLTVVADPSLAFSFSEGTDPGHRKAERQEGRKRTSKEKTETKNQPIEKQATSGLSLLA